MAFSNSDKRSGLLSAAAIFAMSVFLMVGASAQDVPPQSSTPRRPSRASQSLPPTETPQSYTPEQVEHGKKLFSAHCSFCHGRDLRGGESGPDLTRSNLVAQDVRGDKIGVVVRTGRVEKGMPQFELSDSDLLGIVAFIHTGKIEAESELGSRRVVLAADLRTGDSDLGMKYFNGAGHCVACHSPTGDLAGIANRLEGLQLLRRMLNPGDRGEGIPGVSAMTRVIPTSVSVVLPSGQTISGEMAYRDEFTIALIDSTGRYRSWSTSEVRYTVKDPLETHWEQLGKYTDADIHNLFSYLETLR
jgi:cytochrome c oxidase cbb3-type subunit 3